MQVTPKTCADSAKKFHPSLGQANSPQERIASAAMKAQDRGKNATI
jgi:hypothetical protein